ncbi:MAG: DUF4136 domain-containing protein [Candidatus Aminicenantes bacterium]|nr:DUF4136 domain-containing protein [Candidatus Aminicenantes bacterium]
MKKAARLLLMAMVLLMASCSSLTVMFDYDRQEDFSQYRSFDFLPLPKDIRQETSDLVIKRIFAATTRHLQAKGFEFTTSNPDLLIAIHVESKDKFNVTNWGYHYAPYDFYWRGHGYWHGGGIDVQQYEEGTLILDMVRADEKEMIWRGAASRALPLNPSPDKLDKIVNEAVAKILENFPPVQYHLEGNDHSCIQLALNHGFTT